ncbi:MAG: bifunctional folylpolyglutamate synthase/dihydrofolate synthase [Paracoccaceae bacterium]|jgi:dihydrofolate synthase/folylpolyglutamate synthase|nr:bifunctional folylpolyglutamate synthase/dihydrofolate synthase [Paracoccaceae bacterium]
MTQGSDVILERMMALHPKIIDLTLDRVWRLLEALDNPQNKLPPVIHIAGTNGKGSTQAMIRAGLEAAGLRVHAYTSPHLARFHERIRLAGALISEELLTDILDECYAANGGESITYFEITTVAAILAFSRVPADYVLLEVGLGGRLDATNVVEQPALSVITPIDIDHQQFLGNTLPEIAGEKAGIIKQGVPCVIGRQHEEVMAVIEHRAAALGVPIIAQGQHWHIEAERDGVVFQDDTGLLDLPHPALPGPHQIQNAGMVIAALRHLGLRPEVCEAALRNATWPARMQRLATGPLVDAAKGADLWLDGGHNPAAAIAIAETLAEHPDRETYLITGMLKTKDVSGYFKPLASFARHVYAVSIENEAATLSAQETADAAIGAGLSATPMPSVEAAVAQIVQDAPHARILICGSLYLAGDILKTHG